MFEHRYLELKAHGEPTFPFSVYRVKQDAAAHTILRIHWHDEMEIIFQAKGQARYRVEGEEVTLRTGDAVIVHPGELHSGTNSSEEEVCYYSIVFKLSWLSSPQDNDRIQQRYIGPLLRGQTRLQRLLIASDPTHARLLLYIKQILEHFNEPAPPYEMSIKGLLLLLFADYHRAEQVIIVNTNKKTHYEQEASKQIKQVLDFIDEHSKEQIKLEQLASILSLSRSHFCTFFKAQTGMRPIEYLNYVRINKAARLLRIDSCNVLEAALESGFQHASYFSKWFKVYMNMTPLAYKRHYSLHKNNIVIEN